MKDTNIPDDTSIFDDGVERLSDDLSINDILGPVDQYEDML